MKALSYSVPYSSTPYTSYPWSASLPFNDACSGCYAVPKILSNLPGNLWKINIHWLKNEDNVIKTLQLFQQLLICCVVSRATDWGIWLVDLDQILFSATSRPDLENLGSGFTPAHWSRSPSSALWLGSFPVFLSSDWFRQSDPFLWHVGNFLRVGSLNGSV